MASEGGALAVAVAEPVALTVAALPHALLLEVLSRVPHALVLHILSLLPVDCRLRCAEVYRSWRAAADDPTLWRRLDLSTATGGLTCVASDSLLRAAAARAAGHLETLDVSGCFHITHAALLAVVTANSASMRELHVRGSMMRTDLSVAETEALMRAAPALRACHAGVQTCEVPVARAMLRADPPFAALRIQCLSLGDDYQDNGIIEANAVLELAADLSTCTSMRELELCGAVLDGPAALNALVDAALARRLRALRLMECKLDAASVPALARLLGGGALAELELSGRNPLFFDAPAANMLANALRACSTLTTLNLCDVDLSRNPGAAAALLGALTGHVSLQTLILSHNNVDAADRAVAGAALGALVGANAPALQDLCVSCCDLGDTGLRPLFDALPGNTHLRTLVCHDNNVTDAFACNALPAVRANGSLRHLSTQQWRNVSAAGNQALAEAEALVMQRAAGQ
jgi:hypothetical protein